MAAPAGMAGQLPGSSPLDAPPPPPGVVGGPNSQMPTLSGLAAPAGPQTSGQLPPEILTGIVQAAQKILGMFDGFAQVTPDLAMDWDLCKTVVEKALGKVIAAGGGPTSPQATGSAFPGGGLSAGSPQAGPGAGGPG